MKKVYVNNLNQKHGILEKLNKYYYKQNEYTTLYTENGIFKIENNKICKLNINDKQVIIKKNFHKDFELWEDPSEIRKKNDIQQIPFNYIEKKIKEKHYRLNENAVITFCVELSNNSIDNYYFLTNENIENYSIKKDIVTFLSLLN